jgi:glycogen debranching enzyme
VRAKRRLARLFERDGDAGRARRAAREAGEMQARLERFWLPGRGFYSMGLDGDGRASGALASNQGHLLWAEALAPERAAAVRDALMGEGLFSGWGIRTYGREEAGYDPMGYHRGTVWPHDTAMAAVGLRGHGFDDDFMLLFEALLEAAARADGYRLPELFAGLPRTRFEAPVPHPPACRPQAWAAGAIPSMLTGALGLRADALEARLIVHRPALPHWVDRVEVQGLRVADAHVDLVVERVGEGERAVLTGARVDGDVEVVLDMDGTTDPDAGWGRSASAFAPDHGGSP